MCFACVHRYVYEQSQCAKRVCTCVETFSNLYLVAVAEVCREGRVQIAVGLLQCERSACGTARGQARQAGNDLQVSGSERGELIAAIAPSVCAIDERGHLAIERELRSRLDGQQLDVVILPTHARPIINLSFYTGAFRCIYYVCARRVTDAQTGRVTHARTHRCEERGDFLSRPIP